MSLPETTRRESWDKTRENLGPRQREVLERIRSAHDHGLTAWELSIHLGRMVHAVRPRLTELRDRGLIRAIRKKYHPETDRTESVWVVVKTDNQGNPLLI